MKEDPLEYDHRWRTAMSCKQSSRLSSPTPQEGEAKGATATKGHRRRSPRRRRAVLIGGGGGGGIAANVIHVFHLLAALAAIAAAVSASSASPSSSSSQSPFRFRFADAGGGFRWKRWETAPTEANNADLLKRLIKRSAFDDLDCRGMYDQAILTQLERICEDCYNLYKDAEVHGYCRMDCFSSETFRHCLQSLLLDQESDFYTELVQIIGKR